MAQTALELITRSLKLAQVLGDGQVASAEQGQDGLAWLNDMLDSWTAESLMVYARTNQTVTATAGVDTYTVGAGGTWNIARPVRIEAAYQVYQSLSYPLEIIEIESYDLIGLKTQQERIGRFLVWINSYPLATAVLWPVPQENQTIVLTVDNVLSSVANLTTSIDLPPGYSEALRTNLAMRFIAEYNLPANAGVEKMAQQGKANIKRANRTTTMAQFDPNITGPQFSGYAGFLSGWY